MVHGITEQHLDNPGICTIASHYGAICTILGARRVLAWNSTFDQDVLEHSLRVWALQPPCARWHCAMRATAQYLRLDRDRLSLSEACDRLGVRQIVEPAHSAYGDCLRVLGVLQAIREGR